MTAKPHGIELAWTVVHDPESESDTQYREPWSITDVQWTVIHACRKHSEKFYDD